MARIIEDVRIDSPELRPYFALTRRENALQGVFICESLPAIQSALECGFEPVSLLMERRHAHGKAAGLLSGLDDVNVYAPSDEDIKRLTGIELSRGVLCAMKRPAEPAFEEAIRDAKHIAVLEDVRDDTNVGAIFRSAAALGIDAVVLTRGCADPLSRRSVRVSMGAVFRLPFAHIGKIDEGSVASIRRQGFTLYALSLDKRSVPVSELKCERCALVLGNEGEGLKPDTAAACDKSVIIPMRRGVDSLNVAAAAAIAFFCLQK